MTSIYQLSKLRPVYRERMIITSERNDLSRVPEQYKFKLATDSWNQFSTKLLHAIVNFTGTFHEDVFVHLQDSRRSEITRELMIWVNQIRLFDSSPIIEDVIADYRRRVRIHGIQYRFDLA